MQIYSMLFVQSNHRQSIVSDIWKASVEDCTVCIPIWSLVKCLKENSHINTSQSTSCHNSIHTTGFCLSLSGREKQEGKVGGMLHECRHLR